VLRAIVSRLLLCAAVMVAAPIGAPLGGADTARIDGADQVALGAAKPADGRLIPPGARKPEQVARLAVVLGILPGEAAAPVVPPWSTFVSSGLAPVAPGRSVPSCKTSRGPPAHDSPAVES
jgi:hypothetical protein